MLFVEYKGIVYTILFYYGKQSWMEISIKDIYSWTNITDSWCNSKIARMNDILASFAMEIYDLYPRKIIERFAVADCKAQITTTYPIAKVRGFFWKWCNIDCSLDPKDCCAGFRRLLMDELYWDNLDRNSFSVVDDNKINVLLPSWLTDAFVVYSKGFPKITSLTDTIDIDRYALSLLRLYMKAEYALESNNDVNASANYRSLFNSKLKTLKAMYENSVKYIFPWALNPANQ